MKTLIIKRSKGALLNDVADAILDEHEGVVSSLPEFKLIEGPGTAIGSGDHAIIEIKIRYDEADPEVARQIEKIIELAKLRASEIEVEFK